MVRLSVLLILKRRKKNITEGVNRLDIENKPSMNRIDTRIRKEKLAEGHHIRHHIRMNKSRTRMREKHKTNIYTFSFSSLMIYQLIEARKKAICDIELTIVFSRLCEYLFRTEMNVYFLFRLFHK